MSLCDRLARSSSEECYAAFILTAVVIFREPDPILAGKTPRSLDMNGIVLSSLGWRSVVRRSVKRRWMGRWRGGGGMLYLPTQTYGTI
eukprot:scaffold97520_cov20-Cyclotella_meneghiniana.AAC.1